MGGELLSTIKAMKTGVAINRGVETRKSKSIRNIEKYRNRHLSASRIVSAYRAYAAKVRPGGTSYQKMRRPSAHLGGEEVERPLALDVKRAVVLHRHDS